MNYLRNQQNFDFSPINNHVYPNTGTQGQPGGYIYNNSNNNTGNNNNNNNNSNALLNQQQQTYNNLNLSTRNNNNNITNPSNNGFMNNQRITSNNIISPTLNFTSLSTNRAKLNLQKSFDIEDDIEFCPEIPQQFASSSSSSSSSNGSVFTHHKFNPYTSSTFSPQVSPTSSNALTTSPLPRKIEGQDTNTASPRNTTPRARKAIEIVNPATGLRVDSPNPYK